MIVLIRPVAPFVAVQSLHILRNLYFISSRIGQNASSQYSFVNLVAIDIVAQYPDLAENLLRTIRPAELGQIPGHPLERCLDLFFLNTAEHFTLTLSPQVNEELIISAALPYLAAGGSNRLLEIFEAAHSVVLAVFSAPPNADITAKHLPFYVDNLFAVCDLGTTYTFTLLTCCRSSRKISRLVNSVSLSNASCRSPPHHRL
jgi:hypothetical protein